MSHLNSILINWYFKQEKRDRRREESVGAAAKESSGVPEPSGGGA